MYFLRLMNLKEIVVTSCLQGLLKFEALQKTNFSRDLSPKRVFWNRDYIICPQGTAKEFNVITVFIFPHPNTAILARSEP